MSAAQKIWRIAAYTAIAFFLCLIVAHFSRPKPLFSQPTSMVALDKDGQLISARIAADGQWRFDESDSIPYKLERSILTFEDRKFYYHWGIDPMAVARATIINIRAGHVVEGGSTITMQIARMADGNQSRTFWQKITEALWAIDIEFSHSKREILALYASHAPFGGNVVGADAAAWRYFGQPANSLSWAESALLAVLPNSPARIHVARNREMLLKKRNMLLEMLHESGDIDNVELELSKAEPLPDRPFPIRNCAPQLIQNLANSHHTQGATIRTTVDNRLQQQVQSIADTYREKHTANHIYDIGVLVADVETGYIRAYIGNASQPSTTSMVDMVTAERSTGSILKPFLYAAMMSNGEMTPRKLIADTPIDINGFTPENYSHSFSGAVNADMAIKRSLNVPLVRMLRDHNTGRFMADLRQLGMTTLHYSEGHYGASLILGGAEAKLFDVCGMYASMARRLNVYNSQTTHTDLKATDFIEPLTLTTDSRRRKAKAEPSASNLSPSAIWHTFRAMTELNRPEEEADWQSFSSMATVAWKTGTSYGSRDAWAVGVTPRHVVGVWVGNATGEGRAGMTGVGYAAPVMFDVFSLIERGGERSNGWFDEPMEDEDPMLICRRSGMRATDACADVDEVRLPQQCGNTALCPYCRIIHLSADRLWQVNSSCESTTSMVSESRFILPATMEYYYVQSHSDYEPLPPVRSDCEDAASKRVDIIYPQRGQTIIRTRNLEGERQGFVAQAAAPSGTKLFWHLDGNFIGTTITSHELPMTPEVGKHKLAVVTEDGGSATVNFKVE